VILAYSVDKDVAALRKYQEENKFPWLNGSSTLSIAAGLKDYEKFYGIWGIPTTYLLDKDGKVVFMQVESNNDQLNEALKKHLEKVAP
jgi:peroxiredoxin